MSGLTVDDVHHAFGGAPVLGGVCLEVPDRSLVSILGPSGCGKTTLLRLIAGFMRPDAGRLAIDGQSVAGGRDWVAPQRRRVGYVAQEGALFPHLDVTRNIAFGLPARLRRDRRRVLDLLDLVGLEPGLERRYPHQLSGGQQQRVALARALAPGPRLVLLDEPFAALDAQLRLETGAAIVAALRAAEATAVLVTHDQSEALSLTDAVAVMRDGRIVQTGAPAHVYAAPADLGVARFVGEAIVLPAQIADGVASCALGRVPVADRGSGTCVLVRPEQLVLGAQGVEAFVEDVTFFGPDAMVALTMAAGGSMVARVPGSAVPAIGATVRVTVRGTARAYVDGVAGQASPAPQPDAPSLAKG